MYSYSRVLVELVGVVGVVLQDYDDEFFLAVVVGPVSISGADGNDVAFLQVLDFLVAVPGSLCPPQTFR